MKIDVWSEAVLDQSSKFMSALFGCGVFFLSEQLFCLLSALYSRCGCYGKLKEWLTLRYFTGHIYAKYYIEVVCPAAPSCQFWCDGYRVAKIRVVRDISPTWHCLWFENLIPARHIQVHIDCLTDELYQISGFLQKFLIIIKQNCTLHSGFETGLQVIKKNWESHKSFISW